MNEQLTSIPEVGEFGDFLTLSAEIGTLVDEQPTTSSTSVLIYFVMHVCEVLTIFLP